MIPRFCFLCPRWLDLRVFLKVFLTFLQKSLSFFFSPLVVCYHNVAFPPSSKVITNWEPVQTLLCTLLDTKCSESAASLCTWKLSKLTAAIKSTDVSRESLFFSLQGFFCWQFVLADLIPSVFSPCANLNLGDPDAYQVVDWYSKHPTMPVNTSGVVQAPDMELAIRHPIGTLLGCLFIYFQWTTSVTAANKKKKKTTTKWPKQFWLVESWREWPHLGWFASSLQRPVTTDTKTTRYSEEIYPVGTK